MDKLQFDSLKARLASADVELVAVSKLRSPEAVKPLYDFGQRIFGENRVQELLEKKAGMEALGCQGLRWHLIGHLQRNKVKYIIDFVELIHGVDSLDLLQEINKQAQKKNRKVACLLQFHVAQEETKFGLDFEEARALLQSPAYAAMQNINIVGIMGMASNTADATQVQREFAQLNNYFHLLKAEFFGDRPDFKWRSMGMSGDYELAISEGSNMVRIGSLLF